MEWISVEDKFPHEGCPFLGTDGSIIFAAYWCENSRKYKVGGWETCFYCGGSSIVSFSNAKYGEKLATHWMPLPEPPKAENGMD